MIHNLMPFALRPASTHYPPAQGVSTDQLPDPAPGITYVVPVTVALAQQGRRHDLLVPCGQVTHIDGRPISCDGIGHLTKEGAVEPLLDWEYGLLDRALDAS